jgi:hypothetical protein
MPIATTTGLDARRALIFGIFAVVLGLGLVIMMARLAENGTIEVNLGDDQFQDISATGLAAQISEGGPVLFPDAGTGERDIIVQHIGNEINDGWLAFAAQRPGQPRECTLIWSTARELFIDACDDTQTVPSDGGDQTTYPVEVDANGKLQIDLNAAQREEEQ